MKQDTKDIARGWLVNFSGVIGSVINVFFYIFLSRAYGAGVVGLFILARSVVDILSKIGILGLDRGLLSVGARYRAGGSRRKLYRAVAQALLIGLVASLLVLALLQAVLVPFMSRFYPKAELVTPLRIMGFGIVLWTLSLILLAATRALRIMRYQVIVSTLIEPLVMFALAVLFYVMGLGINALALAFTTALAAGTAASLAFFSREFSLRRLAGVFFEADGRGKLFRYAAPIGIYDMLNLLLQRIDLFILNHFTGAATVGVYSMAQNAAFTFKKIRQSFDPILIPVISSSRQGDNQDDLLEHYRNVTRWILTLNMLLLGVVLFASESIMGIFGKAFTAGALPLVLLTASVMVNTVLGVSELFILIDRPVINLANTIVTIAVAVGLNLALIPAYGMVGAALAVLASYLFMNVLRLLEVQFLYRLQPFTFFHLKAILAAVFSFALTFLVKFSAASLRGVGGDLLLVAIFLLLYTFTLSLAGMAAEEKAFAARLLRLVGVGRRREVGKR
jgi:O-antigen/teichoic acid export membrane protein